jgi:hypothetical protein
MVAQACSLSYLEGSIYLWVNAVTIPLQELQEAGVLPLPSLVLGAQQAWRHV